jgi:hypothetical protein
MVLPVSYFTCILHLITCIGLRYLVLLISPHSIQRTTDQLDIWNKIDDPLTIALGSTSRCGTIRENSISFIAKLLPSAAVSGRLQD